MIVLLEQKQREVFLSNVLNELFVCLQSENNYLWNLITVTMMRGWFLNITSDRRRRISGAPSDTFFLNPWSLVSSFLVQFTVKFRVWDRSRWRTPSRTVIFVAPRQKRWLSCRRNRLRGWRGKDGNSDNPPDRSSCSWIPRETLSCSNAVRMYCTRLYNDSWSRCE